MAEFITSVLTVSLLPWLISINNQQMLLLQTSCTFTLTINVQNSNKSIYYSFMNISPSFAYLLIVITDFELQNSVSSSRFYFRL
jgi:hypothetical protein